jgi:hypothetical protein
LALLVVEVLVALELEQVEQSNDSLGMASDEAFDEVHGSLDALQIPALAQAAIQRK